MLFGSVPWPPRKPRSSTSTQSARQNTAAPITAIRASRTSERAALRQNAAPAAVSASTATRFTANPCDPVKLPKPETITSSALGCGVPVIDWIIAVSEPGWPSSLPCQKPRPGHACSSAIPRKNTPLPPRISRPIVGRSQARCGSTRSAPATTYKSTPPGAPKSTVSPGARMAPNASPNDQTISPQATLDSAASRSDQPRTAKIIQSPMPTWIQTVAAAAAMGWKLQRFAPQFTRATTQPGEPASAAWSRAGMPPAICGCACSRPSNSHSAPKPIRSPRRAGGSRQTAPGRWSPIAVLMTATAAGPKKKISAMSSACCSSADRNAETRIELAGLGPEFMPGMRPPYGGNPLRPGRLRADGGVVPLAQSPEGGADDGNAEQQERDDVDAAAVLADRSDLELGVDQVHDEAHAHDHRPQPDDVDVPARDSPGTDRGALELPGPGREDHHREDVERQAEHGHREHVEDHRLRAGDDRRAVECAVRTGGTAGQVRAVVVRVRLVGGDRETENGQHQRGDLEPDRRGGPVHDRLERLLGLGGDRGRLGRAGRGDAGRLAGTRWRGRDSRDRSRARAFAV